MPTAVGLNAHSVQVVEERIETTDYIPRRRAS